MSVLADTHALVWFLHADERLSSRARRTLDNAQQDPAAGIVVSVATRMDLHYLVRKGTFDAEQVRRLWAVTADPALNISAADITSSVVEHFDRPELQALRDPWDRLITATAIDRGLPLVTRDEAITVVAAEGLLQVVW